MRKIFLSKDIFTLVDDVDYEWLKQWSWSISSKGYARRADRTGGKRQYIRMHRQIMNAPIDMQVDHIDGNRLNNQRGNLRLCTPQENQRNRKPQSGGTSKYKGVSWKKNGNKWRAIITIDCKLISLGVFSDEIEAARAYDIAALQHFGEFAYLNFK